MNWLARAALFALLVPALAAADTPSRGPSTAAERRRALDVTHRLERDPFGKGADADRRWLLQWIVEIPDVNVSSCSGPLDALMQDTEGERHGRDLFVQSVFGMAAFLVEHPAQKGDWVAVQKAGIESVLRAYHSMHTADESVRWPQLDRLESARKEGKLAALVRERVSCREEDQEIPPNTI